MAKVEIEQSELEELARSRILINKLSASPDAKRHLERSIKTLMPEVETEEDVFNRAAAPHVETIKSLQEQLAATNKRLDDDAKARREDAEQRETTSAFNALRQAGYQEDGIEKIKAIMVDRKIADPEAAAALFDRLNPPPAQEAAGWEPDAWDLTPKGMDEKSMKLLFDNEDRWADNEVSKVINEERRKAAA